MFAVLYTSISLPVTQISIERPTEALVVGILLSRETMVCAAEFTKKGLKTKF